MISGLKVVISGDELRGLCAKRAEFHREKALAYAREAERLDGMSIPSTKLSHGNPIEGMKEQADEHAKSDQEMRFIAEHIDTAESYLLDRQDLVKLGVCSRAY